MPEPNPDAEVEEVLAAIRRLIVEGPARTRPDAAPSGPFLLTPAHRIGAAAEPSDAPLPGSEAPSAGDAASLAGPGPAGEGGPEPSVPGASGPLGHPSSGGDAGALGPLVLRPGPVAAPDRSTLGHEPPPLDAASGEPPLLEPLVLRPWPAEPPATGLPDPDGCVAASPADPWALAGRPPASGTALPVAGPPVAGPPAPGGGQAAPGPLILDNALPPVADGPPYALPASGTGALPEGEPGPDAAPDPAPEGEADGTGEAAGPEPRPSEAPGLRAGAPGGDGLPGEAAARDPSDPRPAEAAGPLPDLRPRREDPEARDPLREPEPAWGEPSGAADHDWPELRAAAPPEAARPPAGPSAGAAAAPRPGPADHEDAVVAAVLAAAAEPMPGPPPPSPGPTEAHRPAPPELRALVAELVREEVGRELAALREAVRQEVIEALRDPARPPAGEPR